MSLAPAVVCTVHRSRFVGCLTLALWSCGATLAIRAVADAGPGWRAWLLGATVLATGAFAARHWLRAPQGVLRWNGSGWTWQQASVGDREHPGTPVLRLDLQRLLLVHWQPEDGGALHWFWLDAESTEGARDWHALRCALHLRQTPTPAVPISDGGAGRTHASSGNPT